MYVHPSAHPHIHTPTPTPKHTHTRPDRLATSEVPANEYTTMVLRLKRIQSLHITLRFCPLPILSPPPLLPTYDHTHLGKCPQRSHFQSSCQVCTYSRLSTPCLARVPRHNSKEITPREGLVIPSEMFFTSRDETPGKDGAKTPSLEEREETTALLYRTGQVV